MTRAISLGTMVKQLAGMLGTDGLNAWESGFVRNLDEKTANGERTSYLSADQSLKLEQIWRKHFA